MPVWLIATLLLAWLPAVAAEPGPDLLHRVLPAADRFEPVAGPPAYWRGRHGDAIVGAALSTAAAIGSVGYSGKSLDILVGIDAGGTITGALVLEQHEPIMATGATAAEFDRLVGSLAGRSLREPVSVVRAGAGPGQIDAVADSEPLGSILSATKNVHTVADQALDAPYRDEYCCATVVSGKFLARDPSGAARMTRALLKGALWVEKNPTAAANLSVEKKYVASTVEVNAHAIGKLTYMPGVTGCRDSVLSAAKEMKTAGLLNPSTDPVELAGRAWADLDGVTDDWIKSLKVEEVAGGAALPLLDPVSLARLFAGDHKFELMCCGGCSKPSGMCGW